VTPDRPTAGPEPLGTRVRRAVQELKALVTRSDRHTDRLARVPVRVSVTGTRGKSTLTRWLHDELVAREYDTYAKVTGDEPLSIYNGREWVIPRGDQVRLYENEREIERFFPMDAIVVENQGITPYTTRLVHTRYLDPTLVVLTNVREDHLDTLGGTRERVARALSRSIPNDAHVICGEQADSVREYVAEELTQRDATVTFVDVPAEHGHIPGAELVFCLDEALRHATDTTLDDESAGEYLDSLRVDWTHLPEGPVFDAASVNDVQSTEAVRRSLVGSTEQVIQPLVYLRRDRPGRTASYIRYLNLLYERGLVEQARVVDGHGAAFAARTEAPVIRHRPSDDPEQVLRAALHDGWSVMLMGNATPEFMQELRAVIERLATDTGDVTTGNRLARTGSLEHIATPGKQVLLLDGSPPGAHPDVCPTLLEVGDPDGVLWLSFDDGPDAIRDRWLDHHGSAATLDHRVITVAATARAAAASQPQATTGPQVLADGSAPVAADTVASISDLPAAIAEILDEWGADATVRVCVDPLTRILERHSLRATFRMLHPLSRQLSAADVNAHYHLSRPVVDEETVRTLAPLFDTLLTVNEHGTWRVTE